MIDAGVIDQDSPSIPNLTPMSVTLLTVLADGESQGGCGFSVYAQIAPSEIPAKYMEDLEDELQKPTGRWTVKRPPLKLNGVLLSRECGILYNLHDAEGLRYGFNVSCLGTQLSACLKVSVVLSEGCHMSERSVLTQSVY